MVYLCLCSFSARFFIINNKTGCPKVLSQWDHKYFTLAGNCLGEDLSGEERWIRGRDNFHETAAPSVKPVIKNDEEVRT